jgi:hypothetical protein
MAAGNSHFWQCEGTRIEDRRARPFQQQRTASIVNELAKGSVG